MKFRKSALAGLAAIATVVAAASPAAAAFFQFPSLTNLTSDDVTITGVSWSGSYVQIPTPVPAGQTKGGTYHTVSTFGEGFVDFTVNITTPGRVGQSCFFTLNVDNATGHLDFTSAVGTGTAGAICSANGVAFTIQ